MLPRGAREEDGQVTWESPTVSSGSGGEEEAPQTKPQPAGALCRCAPGGAFVAKNKHRPSVGERQGRPEAPPMAMGKSEDRIRATKRGNGWRPEPV